MERKAIPVFVVPTGDGSHPVEQTTIASTAHTNAKACAPVTNVETILVSTQVRRVEQVVASTCPTQPL